MPMPLSDTVMVRAALSKDTRMRKSFAAGSSAGFDIDSKRSLSQASDPLDTSSRRKISLFEYREWIIRLRSCLTSAWNPRVSLCSVSVVLIPIRSFLRYAALRYAAARDGSWRSAAARPGDGFWDGRNGSQARFGAASGRVPGSCAGPEAPARRCRVMPSTAFPGKLSGNSRPVVEAGALSRGRSGPQPDCCTVLLQYSTDGVRTNRYSRLRQQRRSRGFSIAIPIRYDDLT